MDDDHVRAFCAEQHPRLVGALALYTGDQHLAEECAQEALTRAVRDWPRIERLDRPGAYVHRIAMNLANGHYRRLGARRRAERRLSGGVTEALLPPDTADAVAVRDAVAALPPRRRAVVVLSYHAGLTHQEIGEVLGISIGTVKSQLHRALASLRGSLHLDEEDVHAR